MRHIVCLVQNTPRVHLYHVDLFNLETPSFVHGLSNPRIGLRPYLKKLKIWVETRNSLHKVIFLPNTNNFKTDLFYPWGPNK